MDFSAPNFKYQIYVYKNNSEKADKVIYFSDGYEVGPSGAITFYQIYRDEDGKPKKVAVASFPAGKWDNCFLVDQFNNYLALNAKAKKYSTMATPGATVSSDDTYNSGYHSESQSSSNMSSHVQSEPSYEEHNTHDESSYQDSSHVESNHNNNDHSSSQSYDGYVDLDAPSMSSSTHDNEHNHEKNQSEPSQNYSYNYNEEASSSTDNSSHSNHSNSSDDYSNLESFLDEGPTSTSSSSETNTENKNDSYSYDNNSSLGENNSSSHQKEETEEASIDSIYNSPSTPTQPTNESSGSYNNSSSYSSSSTASTSNMGGSSSYSNGNSGGYSNSKPSYNNNNKFNKGGNNQQMSFAEMKALKETFLANSIGSYMNMKDKIFNLDEIVAYATRFNANSIRFSPDDVVLVAYNLIKEKKVSPEKYTTKEKQKRLNMYLPPIIKRHGLEKKSMLVTYLNDKEETKDMNLLDLGAWLVYNGYV